MTHSPRVAELLASLHLDPAWAETVTLTGDNPVYDTKWKVSEAGATALALQAAIINQIHHIQHNSYQTADINVTHAGLSLNNFEFQRLRGYPVAFPEPSYPLTTYFQCRDGRWIFLHAGYPALRNGLLKLLNCANTTAAITNAVATWDSFDLEQAIADRGLCGAVLRSRDEWLTTEQGMALADQPVVKVTKIGDTDPIAFSPADRPLDNINILDLTHVIAGPTSTRLLAEQGANVLHIAGPNQQILPSFVMDTGWGKRGALLNLDQDHALKTMNELVGECDVFVQSYRPNALNRFGLSPEQLAQKHPGIISVNVSCYGDVGPWRLRPGWEQLGQTVSGIAAGHSSMDAPSLLPCCICDYTTGYMAAAGALAALVRRSQEGGSYHVEVSLTRSAMWAMSFGTQDINPDQQPTQDQIQSYLDTRDSPYGPITHLSPVSQFSETKAYWATPTEPLGYSPASWHQDPLHHPTKSFHTALNSPLKI